MHELLGFIQETTQLENFSCVSAYVQSSDVAIVYVKVKGTAAGFDAIKLCKVLREKTGSKRVKHAFATVDQNTGALEDSAQQLQEEDEENRYQVDYCEDVVTVDALKPLALIDVSVAGKRYNGHIRVADEDWQLVPDAAAPSDQELLQVRGLDSYDVRTAFPGCKSYAIQDQGACGSCWAFAAARSYSDRLCQLNNSRWNVAISEQDIISCNAEGGFYMDKDRILGAAGKWQPADGCDGGNALNAYILMNNASRVTRSAHEYSGNGFKVDACGPRKPSIAFGIQSGQIYKVPKGAIDTIKTQLVAGGTLSCAIDAYSDFAAYRGSAVYVRTSPEEEFLGGHAVALVGWGTDAAGTPYWIIANSWGTAWGDGGYGKVRLGTNEIGIEAEVTYAKPAEPAACLDRPSCKNRGSFAKDCSCECDALWSGAQCTQCAATCENGGKIDKAKCQCRCPTGYFGTRCDNYVLAQWVSKTGTSAVIKFSWAIADKEYYAGSQFARFANAPGTQGNPRIGGTALNVTSPRGSLNQTVNLKGYVPGYPRAFFYALQLSLGVNEFGVSRGVLIIDLPALTYDDAADCVRGGNLPTPPAAAKPCSNAYTSAPELPLSADLASSAETLAVTLAPASSTTSGPTTAKPAALPAIGSPTSGSAAPKPATPSGSASGSGVTAAPKPATPSSSGSASGTAAPRPATPSGSASGSAAPKPATPPGSGSASGSGSGTGGRIAELQTHEEKLEHPHADRPGSFVAIAPGGHGGCIKLTTSPAGCIIAPSRCATETFAVAVRCTAPATSATTQTFEVTNNERFVVEACEACELADPGAVPVQQACDDALRGCAVWAAAGHCLTADYAWFAESQCARSCGFCAQ